MTTPRIEEMEWILTLANSANPKDKDLLVAKVKVLRDEAHQAGIDEAVEVMENMKKREYTYEHTYPNEIGVDMGNGYEKRISKGQKETITHKLDEEELLYNQALDDTIKALQDNK